MALAVAAAAAVSVAALALAGDALAQDAGPAAAGTPTLAAIDSATDGPDFANLDGANDVAAFEVGGSKYAIVAAQKDNALQLIRIHPNGVLEDAGSAIDGNNGFALGNIDEVEIVAMGNTTYAIVAAPADNAVQLIRVHADGAMEVADTATAGSDFDGLYGAAAVDAFVMDGNHYAIASGGQGQVYAVQLIRILPNGTLVANASASNSDPGFGSLRYLWDLGAFEAGGNTYVVGTSWGGNALQLIRIHPNGTLSFSGSATDERRGFDELAGTIGVDTFEMDGKTYAIAAAQSDKGVQLVRIHPNGTLSAGGSATNGERGFDALAGPYEVDAFDIGGKAYALVASYNDRSIQLIRIHPNGTLEAAGSAMDGKRGFDELNGPFEVDVFDLNGRTHAVVASYDDDGVQLVRIAPEGVTTDALSVSSPDADGTYGAGKIIAISVRFTGQVAITGEPVLELGTDPPRSAAYRGGNGTATVEFWYTVQPGDGADDLDYAGTGALSLPPGGKIMGLDGTAANATLPPPGSPGSLGHSKDIAIDALPRAVLAAAGSATNGTGGFDRLYYTQGIDAVDAGGRTYAVVASYTDKAVQLIRVHGNGTLSASGSATNGTGGFDALGGAQSVATFEMDGKAYAVVASYDDGVQLIHIGNDGTLSANGSATDGTGGFDTLAGSFAIDTLEMDGKAYAVVAAQVDNGVQLVRIHPNGTLSANGSATTSNGFAFRDLYDIGAFKMGGDAYAITASYNDGAQLIRIHPNGTLRAAGSATNGTGGFDALAGAIGLDTLEAGNKTYALVAGEASPGGVQLIRIHPNGTLRASDSATDGERGFDALGGSNEVAAFETGGETYAVVASYGESAVQLIRILPDGTLEAAGSARNGERNFALYRAIDIAAFELDGKAYALVGSAADNNPVQLVRLSPTRVVGVDSAALDASYGTGSMIDIAVEFTDSVDVTADAPPRLLLATGGTGGSSVSAAEYVSGSGTPVLTFRYTVQYGDAAVDLDYAGVGALVTRGAVTGAGGTAAYLGLPPPGSPGSLAGSGDIAIDGATNAVLSASSPDADGTYGVGRIIAVEVEFSAPVAITGEPALRLGTDPPRSAAYRGGNGTATVEFWYTVQPGDIADDLDYAGTGALSLPTGSAITSIDGSAANATLPPPGSTGSLGHSKDIAIDALPRAVLAAAGSATNGTGGFDRIGDAEGIAAVDVGGRTYAVVASPDDNAVTAIRVHGNGTLSASGSATNGTGGFDRLGGARDVAALEMDGRTYAVVASPDDNAVQLIRVHDNGTLLANGSATNGASGFDRLDRSVAIDTVEMDGKAYAAVATTRGGADGAVQLVRIHPNGTLSAGGSVTHSGDLVLNDLYDIGAFRVGDDAYAITASWGGGGVQLVRILPNGTLRPSDSATNGTGGFDALAGSHGLDTLEAGNKTYALVAGQDSNGVQLVRILPNGTLRPSDSATDGERGFDALRSPTEVAAFETGGETYAIVAAFGENAVQLIRIHPNGTLEAAGSARNGERNFALNSAFKVAAFESGGKAYALVDSFYTDIVQLVRLSPTRVVGVDSAALDGTYYAGSAIDIAVEFTDSVDVTAGAPPRLLLAAGGSGNSGTASAEYVSGSGTPVLTFRYTVQRGDAAGDLDYAGAGALVTRGSITGAWGTAAYLGLPPPGSPGSLAGSGDIAIDGATTTVLSVSSPDADGTYGTGRIVAVEVGFSAPVAITGEPALNLGTDPPQSASYRGGNGTATVEFWYTVQPGDVADDLDYAGTGALSLPPGSGITSIDGPGIRTELPPPGSPGSLGHSKDIAINPAQIPVLAQAGFATDGTGGFDALGGADGVAAAAAGAGGSTYALVAAKGDSAVQVIRVNADGTLSANGSATNGTGGFVLGGADEVDVLVMDNKTYAVVASPGDSAVQLIRVHGNGALEVADTAINGSRSFTKLGGVVTVDAFSMDGRHYAIAGGNADDGVQLIRINPDGTLSASGTATSGERGFEFVRDVYDIAAFEMGNKTYAVVPSWINNAVQLIRIHPNGTLAAGPSAVNGTGGFATLAGSIGVDTFDMGGETYAIVAANGDSRGVWPQPGAVQLIRVHGNGTLEPAGSARDAYEGVGDFTVLAAPYEVAAFDMGGVTYAIVISRTDNGVQMIRIRADGTLDAAGSATDGDPGLDTLRGPVEVVTLEAGGTMYALVAAPVDNGVQMIRLSPTRVVGVSSASPDGLYRPGSAVDIAVEFTDSVDVTAGAPPRLLLAAGGSGNSASAAAAEYVSGSGTPVLLFRYAVQYGDAAVDLDYAGAGALVTRGAVTGVAGGAAHLGLPPPGSPGSLAGSGDIELVGADLASRTAVEVADAVFTGTNTARITYGAPLGPPEDYDGPVYGAVTPAGGTEALPLAGGVSGLGTAVHTVRFGGSGVNASQAGTIALETDLHGTAANGTMYEFAGDTIPIRAAGAAARTAMPAGQMPVVTIERDGFVREVDVAGSGDSVRPAINVTGLAAAPLAQAVENNTVTFPSTGSTAIVAAFAEVSFPPNATARSVPADGLLELYVSVPGPSDLRPLVERVAVALNVSASGVELRRVIEVGDNETRIVFDMPVRILLVGQAGGTAFYVDDADNGTVVPIAALCAADDTAAVHAQLGGAGECQLDLGADRAVYAYHLTEFGTAETPTMLEMMVADAAAGSTVRVPAGTYAADMLVVDKPLTIEPADPDNPPLFTNYTHIVVRQPAGGPVVIRGLLFEDTARTPAGAGPASITVESAPGTQQRPGASAAVAIEGNTFRNTCGTAVRAAAAEGARPIAGLLVEGNAFYGIGGNSGSGGCAPPAAAGGPGRADAIAAGRYDAAALAAGASAFAAQLANTTVRDNYIFGTTYTGIRIAGADGLVVEGNHVEGVPDDGIRVLASRDAAVRDNAIVGANSAPYAQAASGGAGAAIEVWSGSDDVAVTLNRISGSAGAFYLCAGTCDPGPDAADGTGGAPAAVPRAPISSGDGLNDVRFNHNVLAESNTGTLIASGAAGMLNARSNYYPGYAASAGDRIATAGAGAASAAPVVSYAPPLDNAGPVRIGAIVADGASSPIRSIDSAVRAAFELGVHGFNARQAEIGGFVGLEPAVRAVDSPGSTAAARAGHAAALADLRSGASADARMLPVLHNSIASAMAAYDASGAAALAGISAMGATHGHYPFVNARNGTIVAHGANASLVGDAAIVRALAGGTDESLRALFDFESTAGIAGTGVDPGYPNASWKWWAYDFVDPAAGGTVSKRSVLALHPGPDGALHGADDLVFGAGYYPGPGAAHLVVAAGDAPAAVNASDGVVIVSPASTAAQLAAPDMLFRLAPPDSKLAGAVLAQAAADRTGVPPITVVALNDSASLQSMGLAGELARIDGLDALPDGVSAVRVVSYDSALDGWESGAAAAIRSALPQGSAAVYAGRADAFAALAEGFGSPPPENTRWYAAGELARADLAAAGPAAAALALAVQLTVLSQHAAPDAAIDAALALPGTGIVLDESTRGPAYAAHDAPGLLGRAIASTAGVPGSPAGVAAAIEEDVARTHDGALGSPLILDGNGDLALPVTYAVSSFPDSIGGAWASQPARIGELSCGIALERAVLDFGNLAPGQRSRVASQTVINTGTLTYETVRLEPTEWTYAGMPDTLPASITELRELGRAAAFSDARAGILIAQGLGPGMDRDLQYRIDLAGYQAIPAGQVSQTISYLVMCRDAS